MDADKRAEVLAWLESLRDEEFEWVMAYAKAKEAEKRTTSLAGK